MARELDFGILLTSKDMMSPGVRSARASLKGLDKQVLTTEQRMSGFSAQMRVGAKMMLAGGALSAGLGLAAREAMGFERLMIGTERVTGMTSEKIQVLSERLVRAAAVLPLATRDLGEVTVAAGKLGIKGVGALEKVALSSAKFAEVADMSTAESTDALVRLLRVLGLQTDQMDKLGSTIVSVADSAAVTSREVIDMMYRFGGLGKQLGLTAPQLIAFTPIMRETGLQAEALGTAMSRTFTMMGTKMTRFAKVAGMSTKEFRQLYSRDMMGAMTRFLEGIGTIPRERLPEKLKELGLAGARTQPLIMALMTRMEDLQKFLSLAGTEFEKGTAIEAKYAKMMESTSAQLRTFTGSVRTALQALGKEMLPAIQLVLRAGIRLFEWVLNMPRGMRIAAAVTTALTAVTLLLAGGLLAVTAMMGMAATGTMSLAASMGAGEAVAKSYGASMLFVVRTQKQNIKWLFHTIFAEKLHLGALRRKIVAQWASTKALWVGTQEGWRHVLVTKVQTAWYWLATQMTKKRSAAMLWQAIVTRKVTVAEWMHIAATKVWSAVTAVATVIAHLATAGFAAMATGVRVFGIAVHTALGPVGWILMIIGAVLTLFFTAWRKNLWGIQDKIRAFIKWIKPFAPYILAVIAPIIGIPLLIIRKWGKIVAFFKGLVARVKTFAPYLLAVFMPFIGLPLLVIRKWSRIKEFFTELGEFIAAVIRRIFGWVGRIPLIGRLLRQAPAPAGVVPITPLQEGGIVKRPVLAALGESGPEAVVPLKKFEGITERIEKPRIVVPRITFPITLEIDGRKLFEIIEELREEQILRRFGEPELAFRGVG